MSCEHDHTDAAGDSGPMAKLPVPQDVQDAIATLIRWSGDDPPVGVKAHTLAFQLDALLSRALRQVGESSVSGHDTIGQRLEPVIHRAAKHRPDWLIHAGIAVGPYGDGRVGGQASLRHVAGQENDQVLPAHFTVPFANTAKASSTFPERLAASPAD